VTEPYFSFKFDIDAVLSDVEESLRAGPPGRAEVPSVVGLGVQEATRQVAKLGLKVRTKMLTEDPEPVEGTVARQSPDPGTVLRRGREVTLYLEFPTRDRNR
jgi:beta-lactam-binding protein with PASTA domain